MGCDIEGWHDRTRVLEVEGLLSTLATERYLRGPLLHNVLDAVAVDPVLVRAVSSVEDLIARIERGIAEADFLVEIGAIEALVRSLVADVEPVVPRSGTYEKSGPAGTSLATETPSTNAAA